MEVQSPSFEESSIVYTGSVQTYALDIAKGKMQTLKANPNECFLTADTVVAIENRVLGKPASIEEAKAMIHQLSGKTHQVCSAYVIAYKGKCIEKAVLTQVRMKTISASMIEQYVKTSDVMDKAGAYGVQDQAGMWVELLDGSLTNVIGLPMWEVWQGLQSLGVIE